MFFSNKWISFFFCIFVFALGFVFLFARVFFLQKLFFACLFLLLFCKGLSFFFLQRGLICFSHGEFFFKKKIRKFFFLMFFFFAEGGDVCFFSEGFVLFFFWGVRFFQEGFRFFSKEFVFFKGFFSTRVCFFFKGVRFSNEVKVCPTRVLLFFSLVLEFFNSKCFGLFNHRGLDFSKGFCYVRCV